MARGGSLTHALAFGALAFFIHTGVSIIVTAVVVWVQVTYSLEHFGARDSVGRILAMSEAAAALASTWLIGPVMVPCIAAVLLGLTRLLGASLGPRECCRGVLYGCAAFALPIGPLALLVAAVFLHDWLRVQTSLSPGRRGIAVLIALVVGWLAAGTVAEGFTGALGTLADDVVRAWSPAAASQP